MSYEERMWANGHSVVAGVDEAGRGPLAGPVVAAAVSVLRSDSMDGPSDSSPPVPGVRDSKLITDESERERLYEALIAHPRVRWGVAAVDPRGIDQINILQGALRSMELACLDMTARFDPSPADAGRSFAKSRSDPPPRATADGGPDADFDSDSMGVYPSYVFVDGNRMPKRFKAMAEHCQRIEQEQDDEDEEIGMEGEGPGQRSAAPAAAGTSAPGSKLPNTLKSKPKPKPKPKAKAPAGPPEPTAPGAEYHDGIGAGHSAGALRMGWE